jgi:hypothetical protein
VDLPAVSRPDEGVRSLSGGNNYGDVVVHTGHNT